LRVFTAVSLFSGAGGLDLGFMQSGFFEIIFANDLREPAIKTYSANLGLRPVADHSNKVEAQKGTALICDISRVDFSPLACADLVIGGPPCQDFSIVRGPEWDRRGIEVKRGRLYAHFVRALVELQPKAFLFENVPGLVNVNKGLAYKVIKDDFASLNIRWDEVRRLINGNNVRRPVEGYEIFFSDIVNFSRLGVPQKRDRLIIVGVRKDLVKSPDKWEAKRLFKRVLEKFEGLFPKYPLTPIEVFEGKGIEELDSIYKEFVEKWEGVWLGVGTERARMWKSEVWDGLTRSVLYDYLRANGIKHWSREEVEEALRQHEEVLKELNYYGLPVSSLRLPDGTHNVPHEEPTVVERMRMIPFDENHEFVRETRWEVEGRGISLVYRRLHPLKPAYTVVAYGGGGTHGYHYDRDRATLTLREKARLQTFPDSFLFSGSKTEIRAQIGEAVPPIAAKRLAHALAEVLMDIENK